jgi:hypothetical protein
MSLFDLYGECELKLPGSKITVNRFHEKSKTLPEIEKKYHTMNVLGYHFENVMYFCKALVGDHGKSNKIVAEIVLILRRQHGENFSEFKKSDKNSTSKYIEAVTDIKFDEKYKMFYDQNKAKYNWTDIEKYPIDLPPCTEIFLENKTEIKKSDLTWSKGDGMKFNIYDKILDVTKGVVKLTREENHYVLNIGESKRLKYGDRFHAEDKDGNIMSEITVIKRPRLNIVRKKYNKTENKDIWTDRYHITKTYPNHKDLEKWKVWEEIFTHTRKIYTNDNFYNSKEEWSQLITYDYLKESLKELKLQYIEHYEKIWPESKYIQFGWKGDTTNFKDPVFAQKVEIDPVKQPHAKVVIIGDLHSSFHSIYHIIKDIKEKDIRFFKEGMKLREDSYIVFLGDILDRGPYSLELLLFVFKLKIINFENVIIINGNHEDMNQYSGDGTGSESYFQFTSNSDENISNHANYIQTLRELNNTLTYLPSVVFLKYHNKWFHLCHGGIGEEFIQYTQLKLNPLLKFLTFDKDQNVLFLDDNKTSHGLKWDDFDQTQILYTPNTSRGAGNIIGPDFTEKYLKLHNIEMIIRGHQDWENINILVQKDKYNEGTLDIGDGKYKYKSKYYPLYGKTNIPVIREVYKIYTDNTDVLVVTTSSAAIVKRLENDCYIILTV